MTPESTKYIFSFMRFKIILFGATRGENSLECTFLWFIYYWLFKILKNFGSEIYWNENILQIFYPVLVSDPIGYFCRGKNSNETSF